MTPEHLPEFLSIRLLGSFDCTAGGQALPPFRTRKGRELLALLVLRQGQPVDRDWLAGILWPESSEPQALANLRLSLSNLRRCLGKGSDLLQRISPRCLRFEVRGADVDVIRFDAATALRDPASLEAAVRLYRGPLLADCGADWVAPERARREIAYVSALERLAEVARSRGDLARACSLLRKTLEVEPFRESASRALMEALALTGDRAGAVDVFRDLRARLWRDLASEPDAATMEVFRRIRRGGAGEDPHYGAPAAVVEQPAEQAAFPRSITPLIGRDEDVQRVVEWLQQSRLVTLTGRGGIGKTRLAIAAAAAAAPDFPDGITFVDFSTLAEPRLAPQILASRLGLREDARVVALQALRMHLRPRATLLVLDNCEHLLEACAQLTANLLSECPALRVLATSRQALGVTGEIGWSVPPLGVPRLAGSAPFRHEDLTPLLEFASVRLFVERAQAALPSFRLTPENASAVAAICRNLEGSPLAIEMAAARIRTLPAVHIERRLSDRLGLLTALPGAAPRHQTLRATIDWSYRLLTEKERLLMRRLSIFSGGWSIEAAESVCDDEPGEGGQGERLRGTRIVELISSLVERSLVTYYEETGQYRLLEEIRQFALELLSAEETAKLRTRHACYYAAFATEARRGMGSAAQARWLNLAEAEIGNLRQAVQWCKGSPEGLALGLDLLSDLSRLWTIRGYSSDAFDMLSEMLALDDTHPRSAAHLWARHEAATAALHMGRADVARRLYRESLEGFRRLDNLSGLTASLNSLGSLLYQMGDFGQARALLEEAYATNRSIAWRAFETPSNLHALACLEDTEGRTDAAARLLYEALRLNRELGNIYGQATNLSRLALIAARGSDWDVAEERLAEERRLREEIEDRPGLQLLELHRATLQRLQGALADAERVYDAAARRLLQQPNVEQSDLLLTEKALLALSRGRHREAARLLGSAEMFRSPRLPSLRLDWPEEAARVRQALEAALGQEQAALLRASGSAMSLRAAVEVSVA